VPACPVSEELLPWACGALGAPAAGAALRPVAGDASNRRYFRLSLAGRDYIVAEAPPATENNRAFLQVHELLAAAGVRVPALYAADLDRGFLLLEDLGDRLLLPALDSQTSDQHYNQALDILQQMASVDASALPLPAYDAILLGEELGRFPAWFARALLDCTPTAAEERLFASLSRKLVDSALEQPKVLVHRDFHSRNLMLLEGGALAVIDFQDAVVGPVTYDLVSLLRDCYIRWPADRVRAWALCYRDRLVAAGLLEPVTDERFLRWFDWMGLQRHIKVLGTFARLFLRDGKPQYLNDLPLVLAYVEEVLDQYAKSEPVFAEFRAWLQGRLSPLIAAQAWGRAS